MKRLLWVALLALVASGCGSVTGAATAQLDGTYDLAVVGDLVFVTSATRNELRVIDTQGTPRDFVRAPNPLEPLSIPVVDQPVELARDVRYSTDGGTEGWDGTDVTDGGTGDPGATGPAETDGPYVYARGLGSAEISIVGAARDQLTELNRLVASSTVTALAGSGPADPNSPSTLYYATWDGSRGTLWQVSVPPPSALAGATLSSTVIVSEDGEAIRSIAVMPDAHSLAIATRSEAGTTGRSLLLNLDTLTTQVLQFPAPVRRIFTHAAYSLLVPTSDPKNPIQVSFPAGKRIFGVLDESSCGGQRWCQGVIAVDSATGTIAQDGSGNPMAPLVFGRGLINGVTLKSGGKLYDPFDSSQVLVPGLVGVATTTGDSNSGGGDIYFFDAHDLRQIDTNALTPSITSATYVDANNATLQYIEGPVQASLDDLQQPVADGALHSQSLVITFQGIIPGLLEVPSTDADGQRFPVPGVDVPGRVAVGDSIQILAPDAACTQELTVSSVEANAVVTTDAIPAACANRTGFTVRAAGAEPYVVEGSVDGYLGRVGPNEKFIYPAPSTFSATSPACPDGPMYCPVPCPPGQLAACAETIVDPANPGAPRNDYSAAYFNHPGTYDPHTAALKFTFGAGDPAIQRGWQYVLTVSSGYAPFLIGLDTSVFPGWYLPGAVVYHQQKLGENTTADLIYVSYPSAQGVLEFDPRTIVNNAANASGMVGYR